MVTERNVERDERSLGSAMILAAGYGTRLGPLGRDRPKALLPVCNFPLVGYALRLAARAGVRRAVVNLHHRAEVLQAFLEAESFGMDLAFSREEPEILGTGGGVKKALAQLGAGTFCVMNAKLVSDVDLRAVLAFHRQKRALATMVVRPDPEAGKWGAVEVDESGRIHRIAGLGVSSPSKPLRAYMFTGIALYEPEFFSVLPDGPSCVIRQGWAPRLRAGAPLFAYVHEGFWQEHSTPSRYLAGNLRLLRSGRRLWDDSYLPLPGEIHGSLKLGEGAVLVPPVHVGPDVVVGPGAVVGPEVVLGRGVRVGGGARLTRAVVWDHSEVEGRLREVVVTGKELVAADLSDPGPRTGPALDPKGG